MKIRNKADKGIVKVDPRSRRLFLKSAGGLTLALPLLPSLLTAFTEKTMAADAAALRYVQIFTPFGGLQRKNWLGPQLPQNPFELYPGHQARGAALSSLIGSNGLSPVLNSSFQKLFPYMNLIHGADQPYYFGHNRIVGTGAFPRTGGSDQSNFAHSGGILGENPSVDQVMGFAGGNGIYGPATAGRRRHLNIHLGWHSGSWGRDDYMDTQLPITTRDGLTSTGGVFNYLFGSVDPAAMSSGTATANPLLNLVNEFWPSGKALLNLLSSQDRNAVDQLFQLASDASKDYSYPPPYCSNTTPPDGTSTIREVSPASLRAMADIITMAFQCDMTRIVSIGIGDSIHGTDWHTLSHAPFDQKDINAGQAESIGIHTSIAENFVARLGNNLLTADPINGSTSILHNTIMCWTTENRVAHNCLSTPTLLMGAAGGRINTGNMIDLSNLQTKKYDTDDVGDDIYQGDMINRLWATLFYAMNIPRSQYEFSRGGNTRSVGLDKGWGHVMKLDRTFYRIPDYDLSRIGEPWEFLVKAGTSWG